MKRTLLALFILLTSVPARAQSLPAETHRGLLANGDGSYRWEGLTFVADVAPDGTIHFRDRSLFAWDAENAGATFDLTDLVMRRHGEDPYRYEKHKVMTHTFAQRARMREVSDRLTMRAALDELPLRLFGVWTRKEWSAALRRRVLFELWDECAEDDNALVTAGAAEARLTILQFIRANLPEGSADSYPKEELAALNGRRESWARFDPYPLLTAAKE